jgi:hypothetical protein
MQPQKNPRWNVALNEPPVESATACLQAVPGAVDVDVDVDPPQDVPSCIS